jgi:lia operon protein LiaF
MFWGIVLIAFGAGFLLNRLGIITMDIGEMIATFWPVFVILFGLQGLILQRSSGSWWNLFVIAIGVYFLGRNLGLISMRPGEFFTLMGPVAIILAGLYMITRGVRPTKKEQETTNGWKPVEPPPPPPSSPPPSWEPPNPYGPDPGAGPVAGPGMNSGIPAGVPGTSEGAMPDGAMPGAAGGRPPGGDVPPPPNEAHRRKGRKSFGHKCDWDHHHNGTYEQNHSRFIGDTYIGHDHWELRPMNVSHFIGDTVLDLTRAHIPVGETKIYVASFIGDVKVFLPNDPAVGIQVTSSCLIGNVTVLDRKEDGFFNQVTMETPAYHDVPKKIILVVSAFIGEVRVLKVG